MRNQKKGKGAAPAQLSAATTEADHQPVFFYVSDNVFSNFFGAKFYDETTGCSFFCSEQYFMYIKALTFNDTDTAEKILQERDSPRECKNLGQHVRGFDEKVWTECSRDVMEQACYLKFSQNRKHLKVLLDTGDRELVELSPRDRRWGIGFNEKTAMAAGRDKWGQNWLGLVLMRVRERLRIEMMEAEALRTSSAER
jgi:ribA/ribD-fused uncharacterized protein